MGILGGSLHSDLLLFNRTKTFSSNCVVNGCSINIEGSTCVTVFNCIGTKTLLVSFTCTISGFGELPLAVNIACDLSSEDS